jgi:hypothetical protein
MPVSYREIYRTWDLLHLNDNECGLARSRERKGTKSSWTLDPARGAAWRQRPLGSSIGASGLVCFECGGREVDFVVSGTKRR